MKEVTQEGLSPNSERFLEEKRRRKSQEDAEKQRRAEERSAEMDRGIGESKGVFERQAAGEGYTSHGRGDASLQMNRQQLKTEIGLNVNYNEGSRQYMDIDDRLRPPQDHDIGKEKIKIELGQRKNVEPERTQVKEGICRGQESISRFRGDGARTEVGQVKSEKYSPDWEGMRSPERYDVRESQTRRRPRDLKKEKYDVIETESKERSLETLARYHEMDRKADAPPPPPVPKTRHESGDYQQKHDQEKSEDKDYKLNEFGDIDYRQTTSVFASVGNHKKVASDGQIPGLGFSKEDQYDRDFDFMIGKDRNKGLPEGVIPGLEGSEVKQEEKAPPQPGIPGLDSPESDYRLPALPGLQKRVPAPRDVDPWEEQSRRSPKHPSRTSPKLHTRTSPRRIESSPKRESLQRNREDSRETYIKGEDPYLRSRPPRQSDPTVRSSPKRLRPKEQEDHRTKEEQDDSNQKRPAKDDIHRSAEIRSKEVSSVEVKPRREARTIRIGAIYGTGTGLQLRKSKSKSPQKQQAEATPPQGSEVKLPANMSMLPHAVRLKLLSDAKKQQERGRLLKMSEKKNRRSRSSSSSSSSSSGSSSSDNSSSSNSSSGSDRKREQRHIGREETRRFITATPKSPDRKDRYEKEETTKRFITIGSGSRKRDCKRDSKSRSSSGSRSPPRSESKKEHGRGRIVISYNKKSKKRHDIHESPPASPTMSPPKSPPRPPGPAEERKRIIITPKVDRVQKLEEELETQKVLGATADVPSSEPVPKVSIEQVCI